MTKHIIKIGDKFNWLTVQNKSLEKKYQWVCKCDCGNITTVPSASLYTGNTKSCGCKHKKLQKYFISPGDKFGRLTVLEALCNNQVKCLCVCGKIKIVKKVAHLYLGHTKSCGCLKDEILHSFALPYGQASKNKAYRTYRYSASQRGLAFELTQKQFETLAVQPCYYCGREFTASKGAKRTNGKWECNGVDRIDNTKGYTMENCVACCHLCNYWKSDLTLQEFIAHLERITTKKSQWELNIRLS